MNRIRNLFRSSPLMSSGDFEKFTKAVRSQLLSEIEGETATYGPDFLNVVEVVHQRNPEVVSISQVEKYRALSHSPGEEDQLGACPDDAEKKSDQADDWLELSIATLRDQVEQEIAGLIHKNQDVPTRKMWESRKLKHAYAMMAVAACLVLGFAFAWDKLIENRIFQGLRVFAFSELSQAPDQLRQDSNWQSMKEYRPSREVASTSTLEHKSPRESDKPSTRSDQGLLSLQKENIEPDKSLKNDFAIAIHGDKQNLRGNVFKQLQEAKKRKSLVDEIVRLDAEAQRLWRLGDFSGAEKIFLRIIRLAPKKHRAYADLAYGDLFVLARQRQNFQNLTKLWKVYLRRFPKGRFAEDARVGLCEQLSRGERKSCWKIYLQDFPRGTHLKRARLELGKP